MTKDEKYIARCIQLALNGKCNAAPNPMVGAVIVHNDTIIGEGYHIRCGEAHAEVNAIRSVKDESLLKESTIYVSLEPCSHYGKTPPCADLIIHKGKVGEVYNIGGHNEMKNIDIVKLIINILDEWLGKPKGYSEKLITYVTDRAGHDLRYAIDSSKLQSELGWKPTVSFEEGIRMTLKWYLENLEWLYKIKNKKNDKYLLILYNPLQI